MRLPSLQPTFIDHDPKKTSSFVTVGTMKQPTDRGTDPHIEMRRRI